MQALSFGHKFPRIAFIQIFKRLPVNLRPLLLIKKDYNPKGIGLFLWGYAKLYSREKDPRYLEQIDDVLGVPVDCVTMGGALKFTEHLIEGGSQGQYILAINPEKVMVLRKDDELRAAFSRAAMLIPDGIGVVWAMRWLNGLNAVRVPGSELMPKLCELAARKGYGVFLFGSKEEVSRGAAEKLVERYPGLRIVGRANGYLAEEEMPELVGRINASGVDILFVALGSPKQEQWIQKRLPELNVKVCQGIGGTLDTIVGTVKRAPEFFCRFGLEWFYRLITNPKRIRRQIVLPVFALLVIKEKLLK